MFYSIDLFSIRGWEYRLAEITKKSRRKNNLFLKYLEVEVREWASDGIKKIIIFR